MGSGENSPAMVTPHQNIIKAIGKDSKKSVLDTSYGFQENADELTEKIQKYFEVNVGHKTNEIKLRNNENISSEIIEEIATSKWVFSGPGSPTYVNKVWQDQNVLNSLKNILSNGAIVLASAAAMSVGKKVMPVYEMYKVGEDPYWVDGLNLLEHATGIKAAVIAHYNNTQGGTHDTRFCFIGERRMKVLETQLDGEIGILGIDEHTGISFNLESNTAEVFGKGVVTYKKGGNEMIFSSKETINTSAFLS